MKLHEHKSFQKASKIVRSHSAGFCLWQEGDNHGFFAEAWMVGHVVVLVTAKAYRGMNPVVEVWVPATTDPGWSGLSEALSELAGG